jgi:putative transposase
MGRPKETEHPVTFLPTDEGWLYLAAVEDLGSRLIVGWSLSETMTNRLMVGRWRWAGPAVIPGKVC